METAAETDGVAAASPQTPMGGQAMSKGKKTITERLFEGGSLFERPERTIISNPYKVHRAALWPYVTALVALCALGVFTFWF